MYYSESETLTKRRPEQRGEIEILDRELARAYAPGGRGRTEYSLLRRRTGLSSSELDVLLRGYEGVISIFRPLRCECGETFDPDESLCPHCHEPEAERTASEQVVRVDQQPREPAFDPEQQPHDPEVFLSYRRAEASRLASDIYYMLKGQGRRVFLDRGEIAPGARPSEMFLRAAATAPYFVALVSPTYFDSAACKLELAHALRGRRRVIYIRFADAPEANREMPWLADLQQISLMNPHDGLSPAFQPALRDALSVQPNAPLGDYRREACRFLLGQMSRNELVDLIGRLPWMRGTSLIGLQLPDVRNLINDETSELDLSTLCRALEP